jgi:N-ethylmaleimide reductase
MTTLFHPLELGHLQLSNRIIMAPMTRGRADDAGVQPDYVAIYYAQRATAGLIITESVDISPMAKPNDYTPGIYNAAQIESWKPVTNAVHKKGGKIFMQLMHAGRMALPDFLPGQAAPVSASAVCARCQNHTKHGLKDCVTPRALAINEIKATIDDFAIAAGNAMQAGFDGVEIHGGYGYLIHQFLGTNTNLRTDAYGGNDVNRTRFLLEVMDAVIEVTGAGRVGVRLSPGIAHHDMEDAHAAVLYAFLMEEFNKRRLAYVHVVQGNDVVLNALLRSTYKGIYLANGGFTYETGQAMLARGGADAIVYGKPFIANPDLVERFKKGAALSTPDFGTFYKPGEKGYTDYASLEEVVEATVKPGQYVNRIL